MIPSNKNFKLLALIFHSWMRSIMGVAFSAPSSYLSQITLEEQNQSTLSPGEWVIIKKTVKGVRKLSPLIRKNRRCLMEAMIVYHTLKGVGIKSVIKLGTKKESTKLSAHAWVSVNNIVVIGGPDMGYEELIKTR